MKPMRLLLIAPLLIGLFANAGPALGYSVISQSGMVGPYSLIDTIEMPAGTCSYGDSQPPFDWAWLHWMKVRAPQVKAADRQPGVRDHRHVDWRIKIQRQLFGSSDPWETVAQSHIQKAQAYEDAAAPFSPIKLRYNAHVDIPNAEEYVYRAVVIIRWIKFGGTVEGTVRLTPTYYKMLTPFSPPHTGGGDYCGAISTAG